MRTFLSDKRIMGFILDKKPISNIFALKAIVLRVIYLTLKTDRYNPKIRTYFELRWQKYRTLLWLSWWGIAQTEIPLHYSYILKITRWMKKLTKTPWLREAQWKSHQITVRFVTKNVFRIGSIESDYRIIRSKIFRNIIR